MSDVQTAEQLWVKAHELVKAGQLAHAVRDLARCYEILKAAQDPRLSQVHRRWIEVHQVYLRRSQKAKAAKAGAALAQSTASVDASTDASAPASDVSSASAAASAGEATTVSAAMADGESRATDAPGGAATQAEPRETVAPATEPAAIESAIAPAGVAEEFDAAAGSDAKPVAVAIQDEDIRPDEDAYGFLEDAYTSYEETSETSSASTEAASASYASSEPAYGAYEESSESFVSSEASSASTEGSSAPYASSASAYGSYQETSGSYESSDSTYAFLDSASGIEQDAGESYVSHANPALSNAASYPEPAVATDTATDMFEVDHSVVSTSWAGAEPSSPAASAANASGFSALSQVGDVPAAPASAPSAIDEIPTAPTWSAPSEAATYGFSRAAVADERSSLEAADVAAPQVRLDDLASPPEPVDDVAFLRMLLQRVENRRRVSM